MTEVGKKKKKLKREKKCFEDFTWRERRSREGSKQMKSGLKHKEEKRREV